VTINVRAEISKTLLHQCARRRGAARVIAQAGVDYLYAPGLKTLGETCGSPSK
jgi:hypothetical protein